MPLLELIEKSPPTSAPKHESAKGKSENGGGAGKKCSMESVNDRIPRKKAHFQPCALCTKHGGKPNTHSTDKGCKWNVNRTPTKPTESERKVKKANKAFTQMKSKFNAHETLLIKLLKCKESKKKSKKHYDSDLDSNSS